MKPAHGHRVVIRVGRQPDVRHATAVDDFLKVILPEMPGLPGCGFLPPRISNRLIKKKKLRLDQFGF